MKKISLKQNKGFTLVELIAVLTILGLMSAIIVPNLLGQVDVAKLDAEYAAGDNCRAAAQLKLNALEYMEIPPNVNGSNAREDTGAGTMWSRDFREAVIEMSGVDVNFLYMGIGKYDSENPGPAYKVCCMAYQQTEDSPIVFYNGEEWSTVCPWKSVAPPNTYTIGGKTKSIVFFCLKYDRSESDPVNFFKTLEGTYGG